MKHKTMFIEGVELPVLENCDDCGACCMEQGSPPGYLMIVTGKYNVNDGSIGEDDLSRFILTPYDAKRAIYDYLDDLEDEKKTGEEPCCWLDLKTKKCRWHEHRPEICRDFEINSEACHGWRDDYDI